MGECEEAVCIIIVMGVGGSCTADGGRVDVGRSRDGEGRGGEGRVYILVYPIYISGQMAGYMRLYALSE